MQKQIKKKSLKTFLLSTALLLSVGVNLSIQSEQVRAVGSPIGTINVPVEQAPKFNLDYNKNWTNEERILIKVTVNSPVNKKISHIWLPDGQVTNVTSFTYSVVGNGVYTFRAMDSGGAQGYASAIVDKIDTKTPVIKFTTPSGWLNKDPEMKIDVINQ